MKKCFKLMSAALMALAMFAPAQAAELTVFDGNATSRTTPINGYWLDAAETQTQVIYPESALTEMVGRPINSIKFYMDNTVDCSGGVINISLGIVGQSQFTENTFFTGLTQVATYSFNTGDTEVLITFDEPFVYEGGNLLFESYVQEAGTYGNYTYFTGTNVLYNAAKSRSQLEAFIPKTTFDYTPADYKATVSTGELNFGKLYPEADATLTFSIKNTGLNAFTPVFGALEAPFSVETAAAEIASGETMEVAVKFAPVALGQYAQTLTVNCGEAGLFEIALAGAQVEVPAEVVVADGDVQSNAVPVLAYNYDHEDSGNFTQMIYTEEELAALVGKKLTGIRFHNAAPFELNGGSLQLSYKAVEQDAFAAAEAITDMTVIATGAPVAGEGELVFDFNEPIVYEGGNLAFEVLVTQNGNYSFKDKFIGIEKTGASYGYYWDFGYESKVYNFLPTATISYVKEDTPEPTFALGDVNHDNMVDVSDVTLLITYVLNGSVAGDFFENEANVNGDEDIDVGDVTDLISTVLAN